MEKKGLLYSYIVNNVPTENQLIVSGIGYESEETFGIAFDNVSILIMTNITCYARKITLLILICL